MKPTVTELIFDLVATINQPPRFINTGLCVDFALALKDVLIHLYPEHRVSTEGKWGPSHYYLVYNGRYYDSQAPYGVNHWQQLPFFVAQDYGWYGRSIDHYRYSRCPNILNMWKQKWKQQLCYGVL